MGKPADTRSDLWAFGVIVLEMLTGRPVFAGTTDREVTMAVADQHSFISSSYATRYGRGIGGEQCVHSSA